MNRCRQGNARYTDTSSKTRSKCDKRTRPNRTQAFHRGRGFSTYLILCLDVCSHNVGVEAQQRAENLKMYARGRKQERGQRSCPLRELKSAWRIKPIDILRQPGTDRTRAHTQRHRHRHRHRRRHRHRHRHRHRQAISHHSLTYTRTQTQTYTQTQTHTSVAANRRRGLGEGRDSGNTSKSPREQSDCEGDIRHQTGGLLVSEKFSRSHALLAPDARQRPLRTMCASCANNHFLTKTGWVFLPTLPQMSTSSSMHPMRTLWFATLLLSTITYWQTRKAPFFTH